MQSMDARGRKFWKINFSECTAALTKRKWGVAKSNRFRIRQWTKVQPLYF